MNDTARPLAADWIGEAVSVLPPICTVSETQAFLRLSKRHLYRLVSSGRIHAVKTAESGSSCLLVPRASIEKYLRRLQGDRA